MVTLSRFGRNRRLVLILEWLTLCPTRTALPVRSQRRDIAVPFTDGARALSRGAGNRVEMDRGRIVMRLRSVKARQAWVPDHQNDLIRTEIEPRRPPPLRCHD